MAKIVLFSDVHAHTFSALATVLPNGLNSRLADVVSCIDQIREYAVNIDADLVLFGGDLFHTRKQIPVQALNAAFSAMTMFSVHKIPILMIPGNHDQADREGTEHSLFAFTSFLEVAHTPGWYQMRGKDSSNEYSIMAVPYTENLEHLRDVVQKPAPPTNQPKIFLGHLGIQGAKVGADFVYTNPNDPTAADLNPEAFDAGFLGHYHMPQSLADAPHFQYIGAPLQHNWGDRGQERGFMVYDTDTGDVDHIPLKAPTFNLLKSREAKKLSPGDMKNNFVRIIDSKKWSEDAAEDYRTQVEARSVEIVIPPKKSVDMNQRIDLPTDLAPQDIISRYVSSGHVDVEKLDEDYLVSLGQEIFQEAEAIESA